MNNRIEDLKNKYGYKVSYFDPSSIDASFVKETRNKFKMTQSVFAAALNISPKTLEKWEQGKIQMKGP
ncbi:MAG: helix-turn-helix domain-containing protein, partial [Erysipelotrichaceae bacterium]|nr:helix-turn-helix domain-containing protein [Erysipelotrichaceae bacterium]